MASPDVKSGSRFYIGANHSPHRWAAEEAARRWGRNQ